MTKKISRRILCFIMAAAMVFSLAACGSKEENEDSEKKYVDAEAACQTILENGGFENPDALTVRDISYTSTVFDCEIPENSCYMSTDDGTADMIGVFVCDDESAALDIESKISVYMEDLKSESDRYQPEEAAKIDEMVLLVEGNIVVLCVSEDGAAAKSAVSSIISGAGTSSSGETGTEATTATPVITASGDDEEKNAIIRCGNAAYECWYYNSSLAERYASDIQKISAAMPSNVTVYNMLIPLSSSITLPDELEGKYQIGDQSGSIDTVNNLIGSSSKHVNIYSTLRAHRNEYVYFRTDHHWTALGAYYAYAEFMNTKGVTPNPISSYETVEYDGFAGEFTKTYSSLADDPDTIKAYYPVDNDSISMTITESSGNTMKWPIINDVSNYSASDKYSTFAGADSPYIVITNSAVTDGSTCIVVKESFGNALVPFLADHYSTVYVIDYRYYTGNIASLVPESGNVDLIFANNLSMLQNTSLIAKMDILAANCK